MSKPSIRSMRTLCAAVKGHICFADCGDIIPKGEFYIKDTLFNQEGMRAQNAFTLMTLAWHMRCAPLTKADARKSLEDAHREKAKHPTRTGVEYSDA